MSKCALLVYHKNAEKIYDPKWIQQYKKSVLSQTNKDFSIFEINYGKTNYRIFENSYFESYEYPNFVYALNYLLDKCFSSGYEYVANSNCDDWYAPNWIEESLLNIKAGNDIVSSNFCLVVDDVVTKYHSFHDLDIKKELSKGHNPFCHPSVMYSHRFWYNNRYDPDEVPTEDMQLWIRAIDAGYKFFISKHNLCYHRIHNNAICRSDNR